MQRYKNVSLKKITCCLMLHAFETIEDATNNFLICPLDETITSRDNLKSLVESAPFFNLVPFI